MRPLLLAVLFACSCAPADQLVGAYHATVTGMQVQTTPSNSTQTVTGTGTLAVSGDKERMGYVIVFGEDYLCRLRGTKAASTPLVLDIADGQTCEIGGTTATTTDGKVSIDEQTLNTATLSLSYTYSGQAFGINTAGTGTRTFTGPRL